MARKPLAVWIKECLTSDEEKFIAFSIVHCNDGGREKRELKTIQLGSKAWDPVKLATALHSIAETYAGGIPGMQTFEVCGFTKEGGDEPSARYPFRMMGEGEDWDRAEFGYNIGTESPSRDGILTQFMRHLEAKERIGAQRDQAMWGAMNRIIERLSGQCESQSHEIISAVELAKTAYVQMRTDETEAELKKKQAEFLVGVGKQVVALAAPILRKLTGGAISEATSDTAIIKDIASSVSSEHIPMLVDALTKAGVSGPTMALLADRLAEVVDKKEDSQ